MGSLAAGACGLIVEVHPDPSKAMSDGAQSLDFPMFEELARQVHGGRTGKRGRTEKTGKTAKTVKVGVNGGEAD
jgi:3-deoxy-D-manno-octulosonic acid (KDO) 8-phosphate synthase